MSVYNCVQQYREKMKLYTQNTAVDLQINMSLYDLDCISEHVKSPVYCYYFRKHNVNVGSSAPGCCLVPAGFATVTFH